MSEPTWYVCTPETKIKDTEFYGGDCIEVMSLAGHCCFAFVGYAVAEDGTWCFLATRANCDETELFLLPSNWEYKSQDGVRYDPHALVFGGELLKDCGTLRVIDNPTLFAPGGE